MGAASSRHVCLRIICCCGEQNEFRVGVVTVLATNIRHPMTQARSSMWMANHLDGLESGRRTVSLCFFDFFFDQRISSIAACVRTKLAQLSRAGVCDGGDNCAGAAGEPAAAGRSGRRARDRRGHPFCHAHLQLPLW